MDSLFLGGLLASSSTTIIIRAFEELWVSKKIRLLKMIFGVLVDEDIVVILMIILLSRYAVRLKFVGTEMLFTINVADVSSGKKYGLLAGGFFFYYRTEENRTLPQWMKPC